MPSNACRKSAVPSQTVFSSSKGGRHLSAGEINRHHRFRVDFNSRSLRQRLACGDGGPNSGWVRDVPLFCKPSQFATGRDVSQLTEQCHCRPTFHSIRLGRRGRGSWWSHGRDREIALGSLRGCLGLHSRITDDLLFTAQSSDCNEGLGSKVLLPST